MIVTLLYSIAGGMLVVLGLARLTEIAWKFMRLVGLLALAMACVATALAYRELPNGSGPGWLWPLGLGSVLALGAVLVVLTAPMVARAGSSLRVFALIGGIAGIIASCGTTLLAVPAPRPFPLSALIVLGQIIGGWMLGSVTVAWLLGHAYLTATKMTIAPLRFFSGMLSAAVMARIAFFVAVLSWGWLTQTGSPSLAARIEQWWLIVLLRVGVGLFAVGVFTYMVRDCVRLRSTQSATGILYFGSVMAYVGELASQYLTRELGWPL